MEKSERDSPLHLEKKKRARSERRMYVHKYILIRNFTRSRDLSRHHHHHHRTICQSALTPKKGLHERSSWQVSKVGEEGGLRPPSSPVLLTRVTYRLWPPWGPGCRRRRRRRRCRSRSSTVCVETASGSLDTPRSPASPAAASSSNPWYSRRPRRLDALPPTLHSWSTQPIDTRARVPMSRNRVPPPPPLPPVPRTTPPSATANDDTSAVALLLHRASCVFFLASLVTLTYVYVYITREVTGGECVRINYTFPLSLSLFRLKINEMKNCLLLSFSFKEENRKK